MWTFWRKRPTPVPKVTPACVVAALQQSGLPERYIAQCLEAVETMVALEIICFVDPDETHETQPMKRHETLDATGHETSIPRAQTSTERVKRFRAKRTQKMKRTFQERALHGLNGHVN